MDDCCVAPADGGRSAAGSQIAAVQDDCVVPEPLIKCEEGSIVLVDVIPAEMLWKVADGLCEEKT